MKTTLVMLAKEEPDVVLDTLESAEAYFDEALLVVAPGDPLGAAVAARRAEGRLTAKPLRVIYQPWMGYAATRTWAYNLAGQDLTTEWVLMLDARMSVRGVLPPDEVLTFADAFYVAIEQKVGSHNRWRWMRNGHLTRARQPFYWTGALHEVMITPDTARVKLWPRFVLEGRPSAKVEGAARTYRTDAETLRAELDADPRNTRAAYYYAQSLKDAGMHEEAYKAFMHRAWNMPTGFGEECFWAKMWAAKIVAWLPEYQPGHVVQCHIDAHQHAPERAEPLFELANWYIRQGDAVNARKYAEMARTKPYPVDARLWVDLGCYAESALRQAGIDC